jgi:hypothetical protein
LAVPPSLKGALSPEGVDPGGCLFLYASTHDVAKVSHTFIREPIPYEQAFLSPLHVAELMQDLEML